MALIIDKIREDFPILKETIYNKPLVYLDNAATTQKPQVVLDKLIEVYTKYNANIHRGVHYLSNKATTETENARLTVQKFINAQHSHEVIFARGATEGINLVAHSFGEKFIHAGDEIIVSEMEHHSNLVPWQMVAEKRGARLVKWAFNQAGELELNELEKLISDKTRIIAVNQVSNSLGTINPVKEITALAHRHQVAVLIDGAQAVQHLKVDVQELDCDFYVFSGHKIYGPTGIGVVYGKEGWLNQMPPYQGGGEMIESVSFEKTTYNQLPFKFEAGTPNYADSIALATAIDYLTALGLDDIATYEKELLDYAEAKLLTIPGLEIVGTAKKKTSVVSFNIKGLHAYDVGTLLDKMGIAVRTGTHCTEPVMIHYGISGTVRASFAFYNTRDEIDRLHQGLLKVIELFA
ncbi:MAG: cysteine desulfurase CsdA [Bacteroidetes bacterium HGW-Bacteroidetes-4]|jgi:cysteine desulfurase/selenocysteine lyase|nr:MAG: cysteine desulfurase CsdA [Bacteroidetes bacterium HGW-Bacteroidetes-4]